MQRLVPPRLRGRGARAARRGTRSTPRSSSACSSTAACCTATATSGSCSPGEVPLPESVQGIVAARLDALEPEQKTVLRDASVIGRGFWPAAVAAVGDLERSTIDDILRALERKEFIRRVGASCDRGRAPVLVPPRRRPRRRVQLDPASRARAEAPARGDLDRVARAPRGSRRDDRAPLPVRARVRARRAAADAMSSLRSPRRAPGSRRPRARAERARGAASY